jgi:hypothetical protein
VYGECIRVHPRLYVKPPIVNAELFRDSYLIVCSVNSIMAQGLGHVVGRLPSDALPSRWRRRGAISRGGQIQNWIIEEGDGEDEKETIVPKLSASDRTLPLSEVGIMQCWSSP